MNRHADRIGGEAWFRRGPASSPRLSGNSCESARLLVIRHRDGMRRIHGGDRRSMGLGLATDDESSEVHSRFSGALRYRRRECVAGASETQEEHEGVHLQLPVGRVLPTMMPKPAHSRLSPESTRFLRSWTFNNISDTFGSGTGSPSANRRATGLRHHGSKVSRYERGEGDATSTRRGWLPDHFWCVGPRVVSLGILPPFARIGRRAQVKLLKDSQSTGHKFHVVLKRKFLSVETR